MQMRGKNNNKHGKTKSFDHIEYELKPVLSHIKRRDAEEKLQNKINSEQVKATRYFDKGEAANPLYLVINTVLHVGECYDQLHGEKKQH